MKISDIMNRDIQVIDRKETVQAAAQLMAELDTRALPVGGADHICGIVTDRDIIIRAVAGGRDMAVTLVEDIMSSTLFACHADANPSDVLREMGERQVRRMPVVDDGGRVVGLVSENDLRHSAGQRLADSGVASRADPAAEP